MIVYLQESTHYQKVFRDQTELELSGALEVMQVPLMFDSAVNRGKPAGCS